MLCYKDKCFCKPAVPCTTECPVKVTPELLKDAEEWWGSKDAPIVMSDFSDRCSDYKKV